jgi:dipeptidase D
LLDLLLLLPNGLLKQDLRQGGTLTSSNLGMLRIGADNAVISALLRSNIDSGKYHLCGQFAALARILGARLEFINDYPAWEYRHDSRLQRHVTQVYEEEFGVKPRLKSIHGGLECAYFAQKRDDLDMISLGCTIYDVHSVHEKMSVSSAVRTCTLLRTVLEKL